MKVHFFGCLPGRGAGHFLHGGGGWYLRDRLVKVVGVDSPDVSPTEGYREGAHKQPQGWGRFQIREGWTLLSIWDRTEDSRGGSNATFIAQGEWSEEQMLKASAESWPEKWKQLLEAGGVAIRERW